MNICIIGWYGTETLGDRAILDGILQVFQTLCEENKIYLGSLFPFFTERTLFEDKEIYSRTAPKCRIEIFNEKTEELLEVIKKSDIVCMGGGPVMDLYDLNIIRRAFKYAKKCGKKTALLGCGLGPLEKYVCWTKEILDYSDLIIFRDEVSAKLCRKIFGDRWEINVLEDPAIISVLQYRKKNASMKGNGLAVNLRRFPCEYGDNSGLNIKQIEKLLLGAEKIYDRIRLIPMHTFFIGGDDREFFSEVEQLCSFNKVEICHEPQNLYELYDTYAKARSCIGMRYHSVVLQTILNGNNFILDYTNPEYGKISGFIGSLDNSGFYNDRYYNMQKSGVFDVEQCLKVLSEDKYYQYADNEEIAYNYCQLLKSILD